MQANWSWSNKRSNQGASFKKTHPLAGNRQTAPSWGLPTVTSTFLANRLNSHALDTSNSGPVQTMKVTHPTFPVGDNWAAARKAFLAKHGPQAMFPRRPALSKELRKALLATEMAAWEQP